MNEKNYINSFNLPLSDYQVDIGKLKAVARELQQEGGEGKKITDALIWRAIFLYNQKLGIIMKEEEIKEFYKKVKPIIIEMFDYNEEKQYIDNEDDGIFRPSDWYRKHEREQEDKNDLRFSSQ